MYDSDVNREKQTIFKFKNKSPRTSPPCQIRLTLSNQKKLQDTPQNYRSKTENTEENKETSSSTKSESLDTVAALRRC